MTSKSVYAANSGGVVFAAMTTGEYGNLIKIVTTDNYEAFYAHLGSMSVSINNIVARGQYIGVSGNTGNPQPAYHLHFHVHQDTSSINLTGMTGFTPDANYPGTPGTYVNCGRMGR